MFDMLFYLVYLMIGVAAVFSAYMLGLMHGKTESEELIEKAALRVRDDLNKMTQFIKDNYNK